MALVFVVYVFMQYLLLFADSFFTIKKYIYYIGKLDGMVDDTSMFLPYVKKQTFSCLCRR